MPFDACPFCQCHLEQQSTPDGDRECIECPGCGKFRISGTLQEAIGSLLNSDIKRATAGFFVRRLAESGSNPVLTFEQVGELSRRPLPRPHEQCDQLILDLGRDTQAPGLVINLEFRYWLSRLGAVQENGVSELVRWLMHDEYITGIVNHGSLIDARLTLKGWTRFETLMRGKALSRTAFMAMAFGSEDILTLYRDNLVPACRRAGYELRKIDDGQPAGLIDDQIRVALRTCRFVVVDLTDDNRGAYWEAGFGEGLGKPVIYLCERTRFSAIHFDTSHLATIQWDVSNGVAAGEHLLAMIRATLPDEAIMEDGASSQEGTGN